MREYRNKRFEKVYEEADGYHGVVSICYWDEVEWWNKKKIYYVGIAGGDASYDNALLEGDG